MAAFKPAYRERHFPLEVARFIPAVIMARTKMATGATSNVPEQEGGDPPNIAATCPPGMRPLLALGVENALVLVVASTQRLGNILSFASYAPEPVPSLVRHAVHIEACQTRLGPSIYTACLPWAGIPSGRLVLGCVTQTGRKPLMAVDAVPYVSKPLPELASMLKPFGSKLAHAFQKVLPHHHPLIKLQSTLTRNPEYRAGGTANKLQGQFLGVSDGLAQGWVWNPALPAQSQTVEILHEGQVVGLGTADRFSSELTARGIGDGCYWFKVNLSSELFDGQAHALSARVVGAAEYLPGSPLIANLPARSRPAASLLSRAEARGLFAELLQRKRIDNPKAIPALSNAFVKACLEQETGLFAQARSRYNDLNELLGDNAICNIRIAETWLMQGYPGEALATYKAALSAEPDSQIALRGVTSLQAVNSDSASNSIPLV